MRLLCRSGCYELRLRRPPSRHLHCAAAEHCAAAAALPRPTPAALPVALADWAPAPRWVLELRRLVQRARAAAAAAAPLGAGQRPPPAAGAVPERYVSCALLAAGGGPCGCSAEGQGAADDDGGTRVYYGVNHRVHRLLAHPALARSMLHGCAERNAFAAALAAGCPAECVSSAVVYYEEAAAARAGEPAAAPSPCVTCAGLLGVAAGLRQAAGLRPLELHLVRPAAGACGGGALRAEAPPQTPELAALQSRHGVLCQAWSIS
eukprot:TRINITY_DN44129_c0_g1_i2.p2 TRINITY_DN44129_c0_g1~~TRINITY_DN44129_c0_g1_i2.p2  ORF type:complete len:263 (+),score=75.98 TRINITY_DN44129_c0_g1_i2:78-866(+)